MTSGHVRCDGWRAPSAFDVWFVKAKPARLWVGDIANDGPLSDTVEFDRDAMTIYIKGEETYIPGILNKTIEAIRAIGLDYDFVWRTNLSSVLDFDGLIRYCNGVVEQREVSKHSVSSHRVLHHREVLYAGYIGWTENLELEADVDSYIRFASGAGFLLSREAVQYLLDKESSLSVTSLSATSLSVTSLSATSLLRRDLIDDVAIGLLLEPQFGIVHLDRCWIKTGEENIARMIELGIFHFRCETKYHERTVEFMNKVDLGIKTKELSAIV